MIDTKLFEILFWISDITLKYFQFNTMQVNMSILYIMREKT